MSILVSERLDENASHTINVMMITAAREIDEPIDETTFHNVYASG